MQLKEDFLFDNRYRLTRLLGSGGFSEVWLTEDTKVSNQRKALKVYAPGKGLDADGVQLFSKEFELVYDLNHSHLLRPSHFDVCDRSPYLVLPYCEQGSAAKLVGKITEEEAWRFLYDVASGLAYLHEQEPPIIHQDIKPDNILISQDRRYLITDFGISAKARSTLRKSMGNVKSGGTIAYMAPERFGKDNTPIKASDIWSLGATLFELLTGDTPFGEHGGLIQKSGAEIPNINGKYSQDLKTVINKMLALEPWERPINRQIVEWTEEHLNGEKFNISNKKEIKASYSSNARPHISENLQKYIDGMFEKIILKGENFEPEKKWLRKYLEKENISFENYEKDFLDFPQLIADYRQTHSPVILRMLNVIAANCFISEEKLQILINESEGNQCVAHNETERKVRDESEKKEKDKVEKKTKKSGYFMEIIILQILIYIIILFLI